ncbi:hypothetical protein [Paenibacillus apiarius]|uniref:hypothetical protein n=1 Tax=Paenibacillus apiarius TaxID=46240 RepID=UPI003B3BE283
MPEVSMPYYKRERSAATSEEHKTRALYWAIFAIVWLAEFFIGYYVSHKIGYMHSDAISRVANAFYVLYSGDPHLGAIGRLSRDFTLDKRKHQFIVCFESFYVFVWHEWTE